MSVDGSRSIAAPVDVPRHQVDFRVRHYECDIYGHLNNVQYARYMQEAALAASAAVGWPVSRYEATGSGWFVRDTEIKYLHPIMYGDTVRVVTWVEDMRRVRSLRRYELYRVGGDGSSALAGEGRSDWVYLDRTTMQPIPIPDEVTRAYLPQQMPSAPRPAFPQPPTPPPGMFTLTQRVMWRDIDSAGHMNNAAYLEYFEDIAARIGDTYGWPIPRLVEQGFAMVLREMRIQYLQPALLHDNIAVSTWFSDLRRFRVTRHYEMRRESDDALLARARGLWVCIDLRTQRPIRAPDAYVESFRPNGIFAE